MYISAARHTASRPAASLPPPAHPWSLRGSVLELGVHVVQADLLERLGPRMQHGEQPWLGVGLGLGPRMQHGEQPWLGVGLGLGLTRANPNPGPNPNPNPDPDPDPDPNPDPDPDPNPNPNPDRGRRRGSRAAARRWRPG